MKATVELPDELFIAAKQRAAELRRPLRELIERGLRAELRRGEGPPNRRRRAQRRIHFVSVNGGMPPDLDVADRAAMSDWLRRPQ